MQTRCIVKGEGPKSPLFWRFSGSCWFSEERLFSLRIPQESFFKLTQSLICTNIPCKSTCLYNALSLHTVDRTTSSSEASRNGKLKPKTKSMILVLGMGRVNGSFAHSVLQVRFLLQCFSALYMQPLIRLGATSENPFFQNHREFLIVLLRLCLGLETWNTKTCDFPFAVHAADRYSILKHRLKKRNTEMFISQEPHELWNSQMQLF